MGSEASGDGPGGEDVASPEPLQPTVFDRVVGILASMELLSCKVIFLAC